MLLASGSSWLITPNVGLMIWTLVVFAISFVILQRAVFPRIRDALDRRRAVIEESIEDSARAREEANELVAEYREHLREARQQAEEILERARQAATAHEHEARSEARERGQQMLEQARREIEAESRRMLDDLLRDVAELTVMATERVTRKVLTETDQRRLVEDALSDLDFTVLGSAARRQ
ncbi:MAG TPA: F0F1 ATP synthase subunit B [Acidimicrobiales bacterium]|nr:F0F1 ATP synthase subunit B [Acidimicrobiales bacterium]